MRDGEAKRARPASVWRRAPPDVGEDRRLQRGETTERKEGHIGDVLTSEFVDQSVIRSMNQIVMVLHTDDLCDPSRFGDLGRGDVAHSTM